MPLRMARMRRLTVPDPSRVRESTPPRTNADERPRPDTTLRLAARPDLRSKIPAPDPYRPHNPAPAIRRCSRSLERTPLAHEVIVLAGLGPTAQWYRNLVADTAGKVAIGRKRFASPHRELDPPDAAAVRAQHKRRHRHVTPVIRRMRSWLVGWEHDRTHPKRPQLVSELPMIALHRHGAYRPRGDLESRRPTTDGT